MPVDSRISSQILDEELRLAKPAAETHGWMVDAGPDGLSFMVKMQSKMDHETYVLDVRCDDYKELPPHFEFLLPSGERRVPSAYPLNTDSFFHDSLLICFPFNRGAYAVKGGPHGDWQLSNWQSLCPEFATIGDMLMSIQTRIDSPNLYRGRRK